MRLCCAGNFLFLGNLHAHALHFRPPRIAARFKHLFVADFAVASSMQAVCLFVCTPTARSKGFSMECFEIVFPIVVVNMEIMESLHFFFSVRFDWVQSIRFVPDTEVVQHQLAQQELEGQAALSYEEYLRRLTQAVDTEVTRESSSKGCHYNLCRDDA